MKRKDFEHAVRAAGAVLGVDELLVIGSQALHASVDGDLPDEAARSVEVDVAGERHNARALHTDILQASALAYLKAINKALKPRRKTSRKGVRQRP